jgi:hypothetical protein
MIFQTAVRKYVGIHEKVKVVFFLVLTHRFQLSKPKKFWSKMRKILIML